MLQIMAIFILFQRQTYGIEERCPRKRDQTRYTDRYNHLSAYVIMGREANKNSPNKPVALIAARA